MFEMLKGNFHGNCSSQFLVQYLITVPSFVQMSLLLLCDFQGCGIQRFDYRNIGQQVKGRGTNSPSSGGSIIAPSTISQRSLLFQL